MHMTRRKSIALIGGGAILAAAGGYATTRTPNKALAPWQMAGGYDDVRLNAISYALLAPNPHNLQPWIVELSGADMVRIHRDAEKGLPATDPHDRQITIGFGCFLEQMTIAASTAGYRVEMALFPEGEDGPVAEAIFSEGAEPDPLSAFMPDRRSCKEPFDLTAISEDTRTELEAYATLHTDDATVAALRALTWEAFQVEMFTAHTMQESVDLMRIGKAEINANPDGIDMGGLFFDSLKLAGLMSRESLADPESMAFQQGLDIYGAMLAATPAYVVLTSESNTRGDQIAAGRRWLRLNLKTTELGLALHPVSQCLQEYPEMAPHYDAAHELLAAAGETVQMLGRLGYGPTAPRTPRWPLEAKRLDV